MTKSFFFLFLFFMLGTNSCGLFEDDNAFPEIPSDEKANQAVVNPCPREDAAKGHNLVKKFPELCFFDACLDSESPGHDAKKIAEINSFLKNYRVNVPEKYRGWNFIWHDPKLCHYPTQDYCQHPNGHNCFEKDKEKCPLATHCEFFLCEKEMSLDHERFREFELHIKKTGGGKISKRNDQCGKFEIVSKIKSVPKPEDVKIAEEVKPAEVVPVVAVTAAAAVVAVEVETKTDAQAPAPVAPAVQPTVATVANVEAPAQTPAEDIKGEFTSEVSDDKKFHDGTNTLKQNVNSHSLSAMKLCVPPTILKDFVTNASDTKDFEKDQRQDNCGCQFKLCLDPKFREYSDLLADELKKYEARCKSKFPLDPISVISSNQCLNEELTIEKNISTTPLTMHLIVDNSADLSPWQTAKSALLQRLDELMSIGVTLKIYALGQVNQKYDGLPELLAPICEKKNFYAPVPVAEININAQNSKDHISNLVAEGLQRVPAIANFFYPAGLCFINRLLDQFEKLNAQKDLIPHQHLVFLATHRDDFTNNVNAVNETYCFNSVAPKKNHGDPNSEKSREIASQKQMNYYAKVRGLEFMITLDGVEIKTYLHNLDDNSQVFYDSLNNEERECRSHEIFWLKQKEKISENFKSCRIKRSFKKILLTSSEVPEPNLCLFTCDQKPSFYLKGEGFDCIKQMAKQKFTSIDDYRYVTCERDNSGTEIIRSTPLCAANPLVGDYEMIPTSEHLLKKYSIIKDNWKFLLFNTLSETCSSKGLKFSKNYFEKMSQWKNQYGVDIRSVDICEEQAANNLSNELNQVLQESTQGLNYYLNMPTNSKIANVTLLADEQKLIVSAENYKILPPQNGKGHRIQFTPLSMRKTLAGFQKIIITYSPSN